MVCGLRRSLDLLPRWSLLLQSGDEGACPLRSAMVELGLCAHKSAGRPSRTPKAELSGFTASPDPLGTEGTGQVMETWRISVSISHDVGSKGLNRLYGQDQRAERKRFGGFHHRTGTRLVSPVACTKGTKRWTN